MTEESVVWLVASVLIGAGAVPVGLVIVLAWEGVRKKLRSSNGAHVIRIASAPAATEFMPLISGLAKCGVPFEGSELWIFGGDGRYIINSKSRRWRAQFRRWQKAGLVIRYFLLEEVDEEARSALSELKLGANFEVRALVRCPKTQRIARKLETFHPTLFFGADGSNAAWIEGLHRRNSIYAYNVDYISPQVIRNSSKQRRRFQSCEEDLKFVYENSTPVVLA